MLQIGTHGTRVTIVCTRVSTRASKNARRANWRMFQMCEVNHIPSVSLESESTLIVRVKLFQPTWVLIFDRFLEKRNLHVINRLDFVHEGRKTVKRWIFHCQEQRGLKGLLESSQ